MPEAGSESLVNAVRPEIVSQLDPQFYEIYTKYQAPYLRADQVTYEEYNSDRPKYSRPITPGPLPEVGSDEIHNIKVDQPEGEILAQVFVPTKEATQAGGLMTSNGKLPAHIDFHGGGWVIGNLKSDESWCRQACQAVGCVIVNVDYRMAPDFPFPTSIWDAWSSVKWVFSQSEMLGIDSSRISVGGLSAGGHLAAVVALLARDEPSMKPLVLQMLVVPALDLRFVPIEGSCDPKTVPYETYVSCEHAPCLPLQRMRWFLNLFLGTDPERRKNAGEQWIASPMIAESHANLAPASILCAEFDVLRSEGVEYNDVLNKAGTPSTCKVYKGVCHPWGHWDGELEKAKEYIRDTIDILKRVYKLPQ